jgi:predicted nucleic acid-binding protein
VIFADTLFWVAARLRRNERHQEAIELLKEYRQQTLLTTNHVRGETWTFLRRRDDHRGAVEYLDMLDQSRRIRVEPVGERLEEEALAWLRLHDEREYSYVDATSFALMRSLRIREALAFDSDFTAAGFIELRSGAGPG